MFIIVKMDGQFTSSFVLKHVRLAITEHYLTADLTFSRSGAYILHVYCNVAQSTIVGGIKTDLLHEVWCKRRGRGVVYGRTQAQTISSRAPEHLRNVTSGRS